MGAVSNVVTLPTEAAIERAWDRYCAIAREVVDNPSLLIDRDHCERFAEAWGEWRDLFLAGIRK